MWLCDLSPVHLENPVDEIVGLVQLRPVARARNDDAPRLERGNRNLLAGTNGLSIPLTVAELRAAADTSGSRGFLIVVILRIHALVNCRFKSAGEVILLAENPMELRPFQEC